MYDGSAEPGLTSVSKVSSIARARTRTAPISQMRQRLAERPVVSRSKTTSSASSIWTSACGGSMSPTRAPSQASRASPSTTSSSSERASAAGARSSAKSTCAASSGATAPRRACTSSTSRSAASNVSCMAEERIEHMFVSQVLCQTRVASRPTCAETETLHPQRGRPPAPANDSRTCPLRLRRPRPAKTCV